MTERKWDVDLLWQYFHESTQPTKTTGTWYDIMDPDGALDDRRHVYDMLLGDRSHTDPTLAEVRTSMIPWNQRNSGIMKKFKSEKACGGLVKLTFWKYMGWGAKSPHYNRSTTPSGTRSIGLRCLTAKNPVRAHLPAIHHYIGIVGYRSKAPKFEFLSIDPWPGHADTGRATFEYVAPDGRTVKSKFLGIAYQIDEKLTYDGHAITHVGSYYPSDRPRR